MKVLKLIKPTKITLGFFILLILLASLIPYDINFTSKISLEESHGIPFKFTQFLVCFGMCNPRRYILEEFNIVMLVLDALIWYVLAGLAVSGLSIMVRNKKAKAIVT
jgi:hypothetical protein